MLPYFYLIILYSFVVFAYRFSLSVFILPKSAALSAKDSINYYFYLLNWLLALINY